jgi:hypothetical protein
MNVVAMCILTALTDGALSSVGRKMCRNNCLSEKGGKKYQFDIKGVFGG